MGVYRTYAPCPTYFDLNTDLPSRVIGAYKPGQGHEETFSQPYHHLVELLAKHVV